MSICPICWLKIANDRSPKLPFVTDWINGMQAPVRVGYYERYFSDSRDIGDWSMQYWDGNVWRARPDSRPHWRQVGDYPAWRGLTEDQHNLQESAP